MEIATVTCRTMRTGEDIINSNRSAYIMLNTSMLISRNFCIEPICTTSLERKYEYDTNLDQTVNT